MTIPNHDVGKEELIAQIQEAYETTLGGFWAVADLVLERERSKDARIAEKDSQIASLKEQLKNSIIFIREQRETTDNRIASITRQLETEKRHWVEDIRNFDAFNKDIASLTEERDEWKDECEIWVATAGHQKAQIASLKELVREAMPYVIRYDGDGYWLNRAKDILREDK